MTLSHFQLSHYTRVYFQFSHLQRRLSTFKRDSTRETLRSIRISTLAKIPNLLDDWLRYIIELRKGLIIWVARIVIWKPFAVLHKIPHHLFLFYKISFVHSFFSVYCLKMIIVILYLVNRFTSAPCSMRVWTMLGLFVLTAICRGDQPDNNLF